MAGWFFTHKIEEVVLLHKEKNCNIKIISEQR